MFIQNDSAITDNDMIGWQFYLIHVTASLSLLVNIGSCCVLVYVFIYGNADIRKMKSFYDIRMGERILFYVFTCHIFHGITHLIPFLWIIFTRENLPDTPCNIFAFFTYYSMLANSVFVLFSVADALVIVTYTKRIFAGKNDWILLAAAFALPVPLLMPFLVNDRLGPNGPW